MCSSKTLISPAQQLLARETYLQTFFTTITINSFICLWISIGAETSSVKNSITNCCFIWKSAEALITNEHYCLSASNIELKLSTNTLHCINYRTHAQTFLSSHYQRHQLAGDLTYQSTYVQTYIQSVHGSVNVKQSLYRPGQVLEFPGSWGSRISRHRAHDGGKVVSPMYRLPLSPRKYFWYSFL